MHFFIEPSKLTQQQQADIYGPDAANPTGKFNITSLFQLTLTTKAFACQEGMMIVQRNDSNSDALVNVIIKPLVATKIAGIAVRYYVYRSIRLDSFFTKVNNIYRINTSNSATNSEVIKSVWSDYAKALVKSPNLPAPEPISLGYGANDLPITDAQNNPNANSLNENRSIEDIFLNKTVAKSKRVTEGMWIGDFATSAKIGFEIVLETNLTLDSKLKIFRASSRSIETGSTIGLELRKIKDLILSFIDPAAFFGMHYQVGVDMTNYVGADKQATNGQAVPGNLYTNAIGKFASRNRVYLDIRSEKGLSYNYYNNYKISTGDARNIRINGAPETATPASQPQAKVYEANGWPILFIDESKNQNTTKNKVSFRLRINGNTEPVVYIDNKDYSKATASNDRKNIFAETDAKETGTTNPETGQWTKDITLYIPHAGGVAIPAGASTPATPANTNIAHHLKVYYFVGMAVTTGNERFRNSKYYDSAFCSIDREGLGDASVQNAYVEDPHPTYIKEPLHADGTGNFYYAAKSGAYWDSQKLLFYCKAIVKRKAADGSGKLFLNTFEKKLRMTNTAYNTFKGKFDIISRQYQRLDGASNVDFRIIGINSYKEASAFQAKESLMLLGLTQGEFQTVRNTSGLSEHHPRYIFFSPDTGNPLTDTSALRHRYHRYTVMLQGMSSGTSAPAMVNTSVVVYSRDNLFFGSASFNALEDLSEGTTGLTPSQQNRIEFNIYQNGNIKTNDNIDFSLVRKSVLGTEHTVVADTAIANDQSIAQKAYYIYHGEGNPVELCSFNIVMANRMKRAANGGTVANIPAGYALTMSYTDGDAKRSFQNAEGDIISVNSTSGTGGSKKKYVNLKQKIFLVHFVTQATDTNRSAVFNATNNSGLNFTFSYSGSRRRFASPAFAAAVLGALIRDSTALTSTGFGFGDGSSYPSAEHVNGDALDSIYFKLPTDTWQQDVDFVGALDYYGVKLFRVGKNLNTLKNNLDDETYYAAKVKVDTNSFIINETTGATLHDSHLHSAYVTLKNNP
jgi:hypothetical protein